MSQSTTIAVTTDHERPEVKNHSLPLAASDALLYPRDFSFFETARYFKAQTEPIQMVRYPKYVLNLPLSDAGLIVFN